MQFRRWLFTSSATLVAIGVISVATVTLAKPQAAFRINRGGTYSGTWASDDPRVAVVSIETSEPVVIENSTLRGRGHLIISHYSQADVTIRNTRGYGGNPNIAGRATGRFASIEGFVRVTIENCTLDNTAGIYLLDSTRGTSKQQGVRIVGNRARNIDGRVSDGKGGYTDRFDLVQFLQLDKVRRCGDVEIAWNEVLNEPGVSRVEDVINIYLSCGTDIEPIRIHDNFIRGAYPLRPETDQFSGGGILAGDGVGRTADDDPAFIQVYENQVLDTTNYGIAISAGHDNRIERNRIVSAGVLPNGKRIAAQNVGAYVWDSHKAGKAHFFNNGGSDNVIGWAKGDGRNDWWRPDAASWDGNQNWEGALVPSVYDDEWTRWQEKLNRAGVSVGATDVAKQ